MKRACVLASSILVGCGGGTDVGNPVDVGFAAYHLGDGPAGGPRVDAAWIVVTELGVRPDASCDSEIELFLTAPIAIDLVANAVPPSLADLAIAPSDYCRMDFKWDGIEAGAPNGPPELGANSILVTGMRGDGTRFVILSDRDDHLSLEARDGAFEVDVATTGLFVGVDALAWLAGIDLDAAVVGGDGVIRIDGENNTALGDLFDANVAAGARLFEDQDGDSRLDPEEHDDTDVLADGVAR